MASRNPLSIARAVKQVRADKIIELAEKEEGKQISCDGWSNEEMEKYISETIFRARSGSESDYAGIRKFNPMFKTFQGVTEDSKSEIFLRLRRHRAYSLI